MTKKTWITLAIIIGLAGLVGAGIGVYMWNKPHSDIASLTPDHKMEAEELYRAYFKSEKEANDKYLKSVIEISGTIREISRSKDGKINNILLGVKGQPGGIQCQLDPVSGADEKQYERGAEVTLKGKCSGKTMLDVQLSRCIRI